MNQYRVTQKVTMEHTWVIEAATAAEAIAYADDLGEANATEVSVYDSTKKNATVDRRNVELSGAVTPRLVDPATLGSAYRISAHE